MPGGETDGLQNVEGNRLIKESNFVSLRDWAGNRSGLKDGWMR